MPTLRRRPTHARSLADPRHLMRYLKQQAGSKAEDIAKAEGVGLSTVQQSIRMVDSFQKTNTGPNMEMVMRDVVISSADKVKTTLHGLLDATELVEKKVKNTGKVKVVEMPDKTTRLEALKVFNSLAQTVTPKAPMINQRIEQTVQTAVLSDSETNEERFRRLRKEAAEYNLRPPEVAGVPAAIDEGRDSDDGDDDEDE